VKMRLEVGGRRVFPIRGSGVKPKSKRSNSVGEDAR
jgi:hypothetical protein